MIAFDDPLLLTWATLEERLAYVPAVLHEHPACDSPACLDAWALVVLPDVTIWPMRTAGIVRPYTPATVAVLERHNRHWEREHYRLLPETPA